MDVSILFVRMLVAELQRRDIDVGVALQGTTITEADLEDIRTRVPLARFDALLKRTLELSDDPAFGLALGLHAPGNALQVLGYLMLSSRSLRLAFEAFLEHAGYLAEGVRWELREQGERIGAVGITCFRPWPLEEVREALGHARRIVVLERAFAVGMGGIVGQNVRLALAGLPVPVYDVVAGLGGRPVTRRSLRTLLADVLAERIEPHRLTFLDLNHDLLDRELRRIGERRRSGPHAENILRDLGVVAAGPH